MQWVMNLENHICSISHTDDSYSFKPAMAKKTNFFILSFTCPNSYHLDGNVFIQKINGMGVLTNLILKYCWSDLQVNLDWTVSSGSVYCLSNFWLLDMNAAWFFFWSIFPFTHDSDRGEHKGSNTAAAFPFQKEMKVLSQLEVYSCPPTEQTKD